MINELQIKIEKIFEESPDMIYGFTDISYSDFGKEYQSALVFGNMSIRRCLIYLIYSPLDRNM